MFTPVTPVPRAGNPFPQGGLRRDPDGVLRYTETPATLLDVLRTHVEERPEAEAVAELGGPA